jgi:hypothetical protein
MTDRSFQRANDESREHLARVVGNMTPDKLAVDLGGGWTVASALAHTGFWDRWQAERWAEMLAGTWSAADDSVIAAEHLANLALDPYWAGIGPDEVARLALESAERLDLLIASAPDAVVEAIEGTPSAYMVNRHQHRGEHLDQIERGIAAAARPGAQVVDGSFVERNTESRRRMSSLLGRLTAADYTLSTQRTEEGSWTVGQILGHLAFWDRSVEARWIDAVERAGAEGPLIPVVIPGDAVVAINPPLARLVGSWADLLGSAIGKEALAAAEAADGLIESLAGRIGAALVAERPALVNRWMHRQEHLSLVEAALER